MKLEDLVPPLELCKKIPAGEFAESVLVYHSENGWILNRANDLFGDEPIVPAPTLAEILAAMADAPMRFRTVTCDADGLKDFCVWANIPRRGRPGEDLTEEKDANPATAALKLWLEVRK